MSDELGSVAEDPAESAFALLRAALADPQYLAEHLAVLAVREESSRAAAAVRGLRADRPGVGAEVLGPEVVARGTRLAVIEGGAVGGPFMVLIPVAFCAALLAQVRMVLELADLAGSDPDPRVRAAELLVLQGVYPSVAEAGAGLAAAGGATAKGPGGRLPRGTRLRMLRRMAFLLGLVEPEQEQRGRLQQAAGWFWAACLVVVGFLLPLVWIPAMMLAYKQGTTHLGRRASDFYLPAHGGKPPATSGRRFRPAAVLVLLRTVVAVVLPVAALVFVVAADVRLAGSREAAAAIAVVAVSVTVATVHGVKHWCGRLRR